MTAFAESQGKIIAVYGTAVAQPTSPGWSFQWNATGAMGDSKNYANLEYDSATAARGVKDDAGKLRDDMPQGTRNADVSSRRDKNGAARFYIASYELQVDPTGEVWVNNGNLRNKSYPDGTLVQIYVNDDLRLDSMLKQDRFAGLFQQSLGKLKKGDIVRVAVGTPDHSNKSGGRIYFTIEEYPVGENPGPPSCIVTPPILAAEPQKGADGRVTPDYLKKHEAKCAQLLAQNPEILFIGDSNTARIPEALLNSKFSGHAVANLGVGGDSVQNVRWRIDNGVLDKIDPKVIVLMIGSNNVTPNYTPAEIVEGIAALIKLIHQKAPQSRIILHAVLPRGESIKEAPNQTAQQTNVLLASLADNKQTFYLDFTDKLIEPDGSISKGALRPDHLHWSPSTYERWVDDMSPLINKLLNDTHKQRE